MSHYFFVQLNISQRMSCLLKRNRDRQFEKRKKGFFSYCWYFWVCWNFKISIFCKFLWKYMWQTKQTCLLRVFVIKPFVILIRALNIMNRQDLGIDSLSLRMNVSMHQWTTPGEKTDWTKALRQQPLLIHKMSKKLSSTTQGQKVKNTKRKKDKTKGQK